jgi:hypothetical protein
VSCDSPERLPLSEANWHRAEPIPADLPDEIIVESAGQDRKGSWLATLLLVLLAGAIVGAGSGFAIWLYSSSRESQPENQAQPAADARGGNAAPDWLGKSVGLLLVYRTLEGPRGFTIEWVEATGSCFAITQDGYLLTNRHITDALDVLRGSVGQTVRRYDTPMRVKEVTAVACFGELPDQHFSCEFVYADTTGQPDRDFAILKIRRAFERPVSLAKEIKPGQRVTVCGFPGDMIIAMQQANKKELFGRIQRGAVRGRIVYADVIPEGVLGKPANARGWVSQLRGRNIEIDASMRKGNSGGPVFNRDWQAIGIATWGKDEAKYAIDLRPLKARIDREIKRHRQISD